MTSINLDLYHMPFSVLASNAQTLHDGFAENTVDYPSPKPPLNTFQNHIKKLFSSVSRWGTVSNRGASKDYKRLLGNAEAVREDMRMLAQYAQYTKPDNPTSWTKLGFALKIYSRTSKPLGMVQNLRRLIKGSSPMDNITLKWEKPLGVKARDVRSYLVIRNNTPDFPSIKPYMSLYGIVTVTKFTDKNPLPKENWYWIIPVNSLGPGVTSSPIMVFNTSPR